MALKSYDAKNLKVSLGPIIMRGFGEDSIAEIAWESDLFDVKVGADGETSRSKQNNFNALVTITLMQNSDAHSELQQAFLRNGILEPNTQVFEFRLYDGITGEAYSCKEAFVKKLPDTSFEKNIGEREWQLYCVNLQQEQSGLGAVFAEVFESLGLSF